MKCHEEKPCTEPREKRLLRQPDDSCVACHMPRYGTADIPHTASTDHRVVRRPAPPGTHAGPEAGGTLAPFHRTRLGGDGKELARDLGVAVAKLMGEGSPVARPLGPRVLPRLDEAIAHDPSDVAAWEAKGAIQTYLGRRPEALAAFRSALDHAPEREVSLARAATLAQDLGEGRDALDFWRRAIALNPWIAEYRRNLTRLLFHNQDWDELRPHVQAWMRLDPGSVDARKVWIACLLHDGKKDEARAEFARVEALRPPELADLRDWFDQQLR
jgi:Tfp pilus assembly protein PilF